MQIPGLDRFGSDQAAPLQRSEGVANVAGQGAIMAGRALEGVANQVRERDIAQQRAESALALAKVTNQLHDAHDEVARGVLDGSIDPDKAGQELEKRARSTVSSGMAGLMPEQREQIAAHAEGTVGTLGRSLTNVVVSRKQAETGATIDQFGEQVQRQSAQLGPKWASEKYAAMVDFTGPAAGWTPEVQAKKKQQFTELAHYQFFDAAGTDALTKFDSAGVKAVRERLEGPEGDAMDPKQRQQLRHQLYGWQQHIDAEEIRNLAASARAKDVREKEASDETERFFQLTTAGQTPSPAYIKTLTEKVAGTQQEAFVGELLSTQTGVAGFAARSRADRDTILNTMRSRGADPAQGTSPEQVKVLAAMEKIHDAEIAAAKENPWEGAQKYGRIPDAQVMAPGDPQQALAVMQSRMKNIGQVEDWAGRKVSPWQPQEAEAIGKMVRMMPPDQAATFLGSMGATIVDKDRLADFSKQIHDKDGDLGLAMSFANAQTTEGRRTSELLLRGAQAEKDGTIKTDGTRETGWKATIAKTIRGAYSNQEVENQVIRAAYLIAGARDGDVDNAVRLATGGIIDFNGSKVPMPYGMTKDGQSGGESRFKDAIKKLTPTDFAAQAPDGLVRVGSTFLQLPDFVKSLPDAQLVHAGQGLYNVRAGNGLVTTSAGKRLMVQVQP